MTDYATYYKTKFKVDLDRFFSTIPDESKFHEDCEKKQTFSIQYERLTMDFAHLDFLSTDDKVNFGVALFFSVLTDVVCFSHFKWHYQKFRALTLYPKFIGNCPSGCHFHLDPRDIFLAMNHSRKDSRNIQSKERLEFSGKLEESLPVMEEEVKEFFAKYTFDDDGHPHLFKTEWATFWEYCKAEIPTFI
jgi:hypothetical protein